MNSFRDLIDAFGAAELGGILGVDPGQIRTMRVRNSIGPLHWPALVGVTPPGMEEPLSIDTLRHLRAMRCAADSGATKLKAEAAQ